MNRKLTCSILTLCVSVFFVITLLISTVNVSAKINPEFTQDNLHGGNSGGGGTVVVSFDAQHKEEIKNFASVNETINAFGVNFFVNRRIFSAPSKDSNYNDIDNVIYMVDKLDKLAMEYTGNDRRKANNCVFGYIRGISKSYCDKEENGGYVSYFDSIVGKWTSTAGKIDKEFVNFVAANEKVGEITFPEFFASFVQGSSYYNSYLYGHVDSAFLNKNYLVPDPLGTGQSIDLLHMFASMDGIYVNTEFSRQVCDIAFNSDTFHRDLLSWLGDLQQFTNTIQKLTEGDEPYDLSKLDYNPNDGYIDFNTQTGGSKFSSEDLLADIDAFNIVKFFIDCEKNSISDAFNAYYNSIKKPKATKGNRFYEFIYTVSIEPEMGEESNLLDTFRKEVCSGLNIKYDNGNYKGHNYHWFFDPFYKCLDLLNEGVKPSEQTRGKCAKLFCEYIITLSGRE